MLAKRKRSAIWLTFVFITNIGLILYLQTFNDAAGRIMFGLPEAFVVLVLFVFGVTTANAAFGWYYLGKPNISDVFNPETELGEDVESTDAEPADAPEPKQTGEA